MLAKLINAADLRALAGGGKQAVIPPGSVLTPSAHDLAKELGIALLWEKAERPERRPASAAKAGPVCREAAVGPQEAAGVGLAEEDVKVIVRTVIDQVLKPACPNPQVTWIKGDSVVLEPFDQAPPGQNIRLKDVVTAREANLCAGFMTFERSRLPWHLTYDEVDYVVEGTFTLQAAGKTYTCQAGDVIYIPKDTKVVFGSPAKARVFYVTYPANWADMKA